MIHLDRQLIYFVFHNIVFVDEAVDVLTQFVNNVLFIANVLFDHLILRLQILAAILQSLDLRT